MTTDPEAAPPAPLPNSYWVVPGRLLAGDYPCKNENLHEGRARLRRILEAGITHFIDLTHPGEFSNPYPRFLAEEARSQGVQASHLSAPITDFDVPYPEQMLTILDTLDRILAQGGRVYLHCHGGRGRTGTVVGCYLVRHGLSGPEALQSITRLRHGAANAKLDSPETESQRQFVLQWSQVEAARSADSPSSGLDR